MDTRVCECCGETKPISGVWYLMAEGPGAFMCGSCFYEETGNRAVAGIQG